ncbi:hypothetical protein [Sulfurimonas sp.]
MVKRIGKYLAFSSFFIVALIAFAPKSSFYYFAETKLQKYNVIISNEVVQENFFTLIIKNLDISVKAIESAKIKEVDVTLLFLYNAIHVKDIELSSVVESFMPSKISSVDISYTLLNPFVLQAEAKGEFGDAYITFTLLKRELLVFMHPSKKMLQEHRRSLKLFRKTKKGEYKYAKIF